MRKTFVFILSILTFSVLGYFSPPKAYAEVSLTTSPNPICQDSGKYTLTFDGPEGTFLVGQDYTLALWKPGADPNNLDLQATSIDWKNPLSTTTYTSKDFTIAYETATIETWHYKLWFGRGTGVLQQDPTRLLADGTYVMYPKEACTFGLPILEMSSPVQIGTTAPIKVRRINPDSDYVLWFIDGQKFSDGKFSDITDDEYLDDTTGKMIPIKTATVKAPLDNNPGMKTLCLKHGKTIFGVGKDSCEISIEIEITVQPPQDAVIVKSGELDASLEDSTLYEGPTPTNLPLPCAKDKLIDGKCTAVDTALGEISTDPAVFVKYIFGVVLGMAGGIALILVIISGYRYMASQGNPEAVKAATEGLTSAIVGLLFIIFAFVILQIIGVDILRIPGFGQ